MKRYSSIFILGLAVNFIACGDANNESEVTSKGKGDSIEDYGKCIQQGYKCVGVDTMNEPCPDGSEEIVDLSSSCILPTAMMSPTKCCKIKPKGDCEAQGNRCLITDSMVAMIKDPNITCQEEYNGTLDNSLSCAEYDTDFNKYTCCKKAEQSCATAGPDTCPAGMKCWVPPYAATTEGICKPNDFCQYAFECEQGIGIAALCVTKWTCENSKCECSVL